eukprot:5605105-Pyramimonas_sp.AAC.1
MRTAPGSNSAATDATPSKFASSPWHNFLKEHRSQRSMSELGNEWEQMGYEEKQSYSKPQREPQP